MQNPSPQFRVVTQDAPYLKAKIAGVGVNETGRNAAIATVTVNDAQKRRRRNYDSLSVYAVVISHTTPQPMPLQFRFSPRLAVPYMLPFESRITLLNGLRPSLPPVTLYATAFELTFIGATAAESAAAV
jgi:hypothetical protein